MARLAAYAALAAVICAGAATSGRGQEQRQYFRRPTVSPYLNLLTPDDDALPHYQTLVRPLINQQQRNQDVARQLSQLRSEVVENSVSDQRGETSFRPTGHATGFMYNSHFFGGYTSHFFPNMVTRGGRASRAAASAAAARRRR